jgi:hypothetical protein
MALNHLYSAKAMRKLQGHLLLQIPLPNMFPVAMLIIATVLDTVSMVTMSLAGKVTLFKMLSTPTASELPVALSQPKASLKPTNVQYLLLSVNRSMAVSNFC